MLALRKDIFDRIIAAPAKVRDTVEFFQIPTCGIL
jgi:hypothetical protein